MFYRRLSDSEYEATDATTGPWSSDLQHGSPPLTLLCRTLPPRPDMRVARVVMDFLGVVPKGAVNVRSAVIRPGRRVELSEGYMTSGGRDALALRAWRLAVQPPGTVPTGSRLELPPLPPPGPHRYFPGVTALGYIESVEWRFVEGGFDAIGSAKVWARVWRPLLADDPLQPLDRLLLVADSANGISAALPYQDWRFVPVSISLSILRYPVGEWVYMEAETSLSNDGIGVTTARFGDEAGLLGSGLQSLLVERR